VCCLCTTPLSVVVVVVELVAGGVVTTAGVGVVSLVYEKQPANIKQTLALNSAVAIRFDFFIGWSPPVVHRLPTGPSWSRLLELTCQVAETGVRLMCVLGRS
jgi:hypothetical protein